MSFQDNPSLIRWRLHLKSPPEVVHGLLSTSEGRARFWAESAVEKDGEIHWQFPNGFTLRSEVIENSFPNRYAVQYIGGSTTTFTLENDGSGGTDLTMTDENVLEEDRIETMAGWVSVLMALKAAADFGVDLRTHDPQRTWDEGFADN